MKRTLWGILSLTTILIAGCGSPKVEDAPVSISAYISPTAMSMQTSSSVTTIYGTEAQTSSSSSAINISSSSESNLFVWSIDEGAAGGSLAPTGGSDVYYTYTAPTVAGIYHIRVTDKIDNTQMAVLTVTVTN